jgi:membrane protein
LWLIATTAFAWYVGHRLSSYNIFYGSIGAVIVLTIWLYLIACIALIGCEFNAERERAACLRFASDGRESNRFAQPPERI